MVKNKVETLGFKQHFLTAIQSLNSNKFFAGIILILLNIGSKFITIKFSKSTEEYLKMSITKEIMVFAMSWMGTRDIITAFILTAVFIILSDYIFNEESSYCMVPEKQRILNKLMDTNDDGEVSEIELNQAIGVLEKAKKSKQSKEQQKAFLTFQGNQQ